MITKSQSIYNCFQSLDARDLVSSGYISYFVKYVYTQLSLSLSASMSGVLALTSPARLSSHSLSGLSSGSGLRPRSPRLSWRLPGEKSLCLLARLAEPDTRVGVRHGLSTGILRPSVILVENDAVIGWIKVNDLLCLKGIDQ